LTTHAAIATPLPAPALRESSAPLISPTAVLTRGLAAGDEAAFREFHAQYFGRMLRYQLVLARGDEQSARDALQETFTRVARKARHFEDEEAFWSWLTVLARSAAVDAARRRSRYRAMLSGLRFAWLRPPAEPVVEADSRLHEYLDAALLALAPEERALIEAKYFFQATVRELAAQHCLTEKAVESRLLRLRRQLRERIFRSLRHEQSV
jgi:RNA polymerase sigma-70 factor (ECF subfamily)